MNRILLQIQLGSTAETTKLPWDIFFFGVSLWCIRTLDIDLKPVLNTGAGLVFAGRESLGIEKFLILGISLFVLRRKLRTRPIHRTFSEGNF